MTEWLETTDDDPRDREIERLRERLIEVERECDWHEHSAEDSVRMHGEVVRELDSALQRACVAELDAARSRQRLAEVQRERDALRAECDRLRRMLDTARELLQAAE